MCLSRVDEILPRADMKVRRGYQVRTMRREGALITLSQGASIPLPRGIWVNEKKYRAAVRKSQEKIRYGRLMRGEYPMGWHVVTTLQAAKNIHNGFRGRVVVEVLYKGLLARGRQQWNNHESVTHVARWVKNVRVLKPEELL